MKRAFAILIAIIASMFVNLAPAAADTQIEVYHRSYSAIPTVRAWTQIGTSYKDIPRGGYLSDGGTSNYLYEGGSIYVPVGWCLEDNRYINNVFLDQRMKAGGSYYNLGTSKEFHSVTIFDPGADGICN